MQISGIGAWPGGTVVDLAVSGDTVLAATFAGIFRSTDGGHTWHPVGRNLPDWFIQAVALTPMGTQMMGLAAAHTGWLYRSVDGGETWDRVSYWGNLGIVTRLMASPNFAQDGIVFACTEENGIFKSTDRGSEWKQANFGLLNLNVASLCFSPGFARDEVVFAGTDGGGLFRSRNAGRAWRESGEGLPDSAVQCLAISPHFGGDRVILAGTEEQGIYRSEDGGRTWTPLGEALSESCINGLYLSPGWSIGGNVVAATDRGLLVSSDRGHTWQAVQGGADYPYVIVSCGDDLLVGAYEDGVYRSAAGDVWQSSNGNLAAHLPPTVCFSDDFERDRTVLMASMEGTLVRSEDAGRSWDLLPQDEGDELAISTFVGAGAGPSITVLAAAGSMLLCSRDSGDTWEAVVSTDGDPFSALALSEGYAQDRTMIAGTAGGQVLLSPDGGASWQSAGTLEGTVVALAARTTDDGLAAWAVTAQQVEDGTWHLILRRGRSWQTVLAREAGEPVAVLHMLSGDRLLCAIGQRVCLLEGSEVVAEGELDGSASVSCLNVAGDALLAGTRLGLHSSRDGARSWESLSSDLSVMALRAVSPQRVYAVSMGGRLWQVDL